MAPDMGAEVIAAQHQLAGRQARLRYQFPHKVAKSVRPHAGIAAVLIDLIAGGFDQEQAAIARCLVRGCPDRPGMRRTDRWDGALTI